jgi:hypothetical protein
MMYAPRLRMKDSCTLEIRISMNMCLTDTEFDCCSDESDDDIFIYVIVPGKSNILRPLAVPDGSFLLILTKPVNRIR